jgi:predicted nucleic acid-binding protein
VAVVLDTGVVYAVLDRRDAAHVACRRLVEDADELLVIPSPTLAEIDYLLSMRGHPGAFVRLLGDILDGAYAIADPTLAEYERVRFLCDKYSDSDIGFVDAAVLAVVERLGKTSSPPSITGTSADAPAPRSFSSFLPSKSSSLTPAADNLAVRHRNPTT